LIAKFLEKKRAAKVLKVSQIGGLAGQLIENLGNKGQGRRDQSRRVLNGALVKLQIK
jgi:hypothetical protein